MKVLCVSGGSAGHLAPLLAIADALEHMQPHIEVRMVCSDTAADQAFLQQSGRMPVLLLPRPSLSVNGMWRFVRALRQANAYLHAWRPDVVCSKGAAVSVPVCIAARLRGIPVVLHESDAVMGRANRIIKMWGATVCTGFPLSVPGSVHTGNPLRAGIEAGSRAEALQITGFTGKKPILLVCGGSQGAKTLNDVIVHHHAAIASLCDIVHLTGKGKATSLVHSSYWQTEFADMQTMAHLYAAADLALTRAGANSLSELALCGVPFVMVPIRGLAHDHQMKNAIMAQDRTGCIILLQQDLDAKFVSVIQELLQDEASRRAIRERLPSLLQPQPARRIAEIIISTVASSQRAS